MSETTRVIGALEDFTSDLIRRLAVNIVAELIETTPVDTGWAAANWVPSVGAPFTGAVGFGPSRGADGGFDQGEVAGAQLRQQQAQFGLLRYNVRDGSVFISNNVPYIVFLNAGSSQKAPAGFVQNAITAGVRRTTR